jgi:hypothetical protein
MVEVHMLTTTDNPYNPFTHWDEWLMYDTEKGYNTPGILARIATGTDELPDELEAVVIEDAIDEIVRINALGLYRKITEDSIDMIRTITLPNPPDPGAQSDDNDESDANTSDEEGSDTVSTP